MKRIARFMLVIFLGLSAVRGQEETTDDKKLPSATEQYHALVREFTKQYLAIFKDSQKIRGDEQQKQVQGVSKEFAEKFYRLAEDNPNDSVAAGALFWILRHGAGSPVYQNAMDKLTALVADKAGNLPIAAEAMARLELILEKSSEPRVKASAAMGLGRVLSAKALLLGLPHEVIQVQDEADKVAADAEKYLALVIDQLGRDNAALVKDAELELKALRTLRVGKKAPDIAGADFDGKQFKLSDYRGKVILLDFWGNW
jgi:hypothetical protein